MRRLIARHWIDALVLVAAADAAIEVAGRDGGELAAGAAAPAAAAIALVVLARRRFAFGAPAGVWLLAAGVSFLDGELVEEAAGLVLAGAGAAFLLGNLREARQAWLGGAIVLGGSAIVVYHSDTHPLGEFLAVPGQFAIFWVAGYALRERSVRAEEAEASARVARAEERTRIARELHDVVAHAMSVMVLQVGAVRHGLPAGLDEQEAALRRVEEAGRTALTEMRGLLDAMRTDDDLAELGPQPTLADVERLIEAVRRAGLDVELLVEGDRAPLPAPIELSAFRIVQEGLTNTLKHAHASHAQVRIRYAPGALELEVSDDGKGGVPGPGGGHGLVGVRERVTLYGGEMSAGRDARGFTLRTRLPLNGAAA